MEEPDATEQPEETLDRVDPRMRIAAFARAQGRSDRAAGEAAGVSDRTIRNWKRDVRFQRLVREETAALIDEIHGGVRALANRAVETLAALLDDDDVAARVRLAAAREVLRMVGHSDRLELDMRLAVIEQRLDEADREATDSAEVFPWIGES